VNSNTKFSSASGIKAILIFAVAALGAILLVSFSSPIYADPTSNVTVDVNVSTVGEITVLPSAISWIPVTPGTAGGQRNLTIKNTGSTNVTNIFSYMSTMNNESVRPYLSSNPSSYSAGGLLVFHNESNSSYAWAGRLEWNWTEDINNYDNSESTIAAAQGNVLVSRGFFRNASTSFVWAVGANSTNGRCNESGAVFAIEDDDDDGTANTRRPNATFITLSGSDTEFGYFTVSRPTNGLHGMCVAVNRTCDKVYAYKYDRRAGFLSCTNSNVIQGRLAPNEVEMITADIYVPKGIPGGNLTQAIWYFQGTAQ
jgi:hypothetical protein